MFHSLRSRLWWSYILVTMAALAIVAFVLFIYIIQNPSTYRQAGDRLTVVAALLRKKLTGSLISIETITGIGYKLVA
jgi:hypothetical protein